MMRRFSFVKYILLPAVLLILQGCTTHYLYHGEIDANDSDGKPRTVSVHWTVTERKLWFDNAHGSIELKTECSARTIHFRERTDGIIFEREASDEGVFGEVEIYGKCGEAIGVNKIVSVSPGELQISVYCREIESNRHLYLQPAQQPYIFQIVRKRVLDVDDRTVQATACREYADR